MADMSANDDDALPLSSLRGRVSLQTYKWLQEAEVKDEEWKVQQQAEAAGASLFDHPLSHEEEETYLRVQEWCSNTKKVDGNGGYCDSDEKDQIEDGSLNIKYILSESAGGHGDDLWAASRHISNLFAQKEKCRELLSPLLVGDGNDTQDHPLLGLHFIELGAGAGLPSWTAMKCGAMVVSTDQPIANRIRCMAESVERNAADMALSDHLENKPALKFASKARVCPYTWGSSIEEFSEVVDASKEDEDCMFDVAVAADCIYMPQFHNVLLDSIKMLLSEKGVALLPFALHSNVEDDKVWGIIDLAREKGFHVESLEPQQLCPQALHMDSKRALIHTLRLTKRITR